MRMANLKSRKAVPGLLRIAAERTEKDNADRSFACRALGIIGDPSAIPDLVHLTYHYNEDTRLWAQISLVRLTGENFGRDVAAWRQWWEKQGGKPPIVEQTVAWATSPQMLALADPKEIDDADRQLAEQGDELAAAPSDRAPTAPDLKSAWRVSNVHDTGKKWISLGGTGFAEHFVRPEKGKYVVAVQIFASRYGTAQPPQEDFHVYLLDQNKKLIRDVPCPYAMIERRQSPVKWYTIAVPNVEVPVDFYVALNFNAHQTKGVYLGKDTDVGQSHSFTGLPDNGYEPVAEKFDWMIRAYLVETPDATVKESGMPAAASNGEAPACTESTTDDVQPDGTIRFTVRGELGNYTGSTMTTYDFISSDFCKIEKITDDKGRPVEFTRRHQGDHFQYAATLNEPVPVGAKLILEDQGVVTGLIKPTGQPGELKYHMIHSPNAPFSVRRIEVHRLPPGAALLEKTPADMVEARKDGQIELRR